MKVLSSTLFCVSTISFIVAVPQTAPLERMVNNAEISTIDDSYGEDASGFPVTQCTRPGVVALTFDDGPSNFTPRVLEILKANNVPATFFVTGTMFNESPERKEMVKKMVKEGHEVGNHDYDHSDLAKVPLTTALNNLDKMNDLFSQTINRIPLYFRFPYGSTTPELTDIIRDEGYTVVGWNFDPNDWKRETREDLVNAIKDGLDKSSPEKDSHILLMHEIKENTVANLDEVIRLVKSKGFKFVSMSDCLENYE